MVKFRPESCLVDNNRHDSGHSQTFILEKSYIMLIKINRDLCTGCGRCEDVCTKGAITVNKVAGKAEFNEYRCAECGLCIDECKIGALSFK